MKKEIESKDDLLKLKLKDETHMSNENYSLREKLKEEISKSSNLKKEVHRLRLTPKEMQGRKWFLQLLPHCRPGFKNLDLALDF